MMVQKSRRAVQTGEEARGIITRQDRTSCFDMHNAYPPPREKKGTRETYEGNVRARSD